MATDFKTAQKLATQAYLEVWRAQGLKFCPPIGVNTRDKHWSRHLREAWPELTTVDVRVTGKDAPKLHDMMEWCKDQPSSFWHSGGGDRWYFERKDIAILFKLTFGGAQ